VETRKDWKVKVEGWREKRKEKVEEWRERWKDEKARIMEVDESDVEGLVCGLGWLRQSERLWILWWCCDWMGTKVEECEEKWGKERARILEDGDGSDVKRFGRLRARLWVLWWWCDWMEVRVFSLVSSVEGLACELRSRLCPEV
jgi:hypothetical protein